MPQLHLSVDPYTADQLAKEAEREGVSLSKYLANLVSRAHPGTWPKGYLRKIIGSSAKDPIKEPRDLALDDVSLDEA
jgi:hypothetical protein